jgi:hypothetical protein
MGGDADEDEFGESLDPSGSARVSSPGRNVASSAVMSAVTGTR